MTVPKPKAVIFDWDDTIINSWHLALKALNTALVTMGEQPWSDEEARRRAGPSARDLFQQLFGDRWEEADKIYYNSLRAIFRESIPVYPEAEALLKALADNNVYMAVVSNKRGHLLRSETADTKFDRFFGKVIGAGDAKADKPDPAPVHMALEGSGIPAGAHVWFVGDSHTDMLCAANSGCTPLLIETKPPPEETLMKNPPLRRFKKHSDLMEFIQDFFV